MALALISVADKSGLGELGSELSRQGWTLLSTGGTARALEQAGCPVTQVSEFTGFPEILDGRVKTLHPRIFAGILAAPGAAHESQLDELAIPPVDLVVVNLYPFRETVARAGVTLGEAVEQIDIGGSSLVRAAAKNHARVVVVVDPEDYQSVAEELATGISQERRQQLAVKAFRHTAALDAAIAAHLPALITDQPAAPGPLVAEQLLRAEEVKLRYGENPHQWGILARTRPLGGLAGARQIQGKALSYNNLGDATGAWRLVWDLPGPGVAVIKHANPCGVALGENMAEAFRNARACDPLSAFGGVIAANRTVDRTFAEAVVEQFAEVVVAPEFDQAALRVLAAKKNLRLLEARSPGPGEVTIRTVDGGYLLQAGDLGWQQEARDRATERTPGEAEMSALELAWRVVKHVGSNAIVIAGGDRILGIGAGQMSRVDAAHLAVTKAGAAGHGLEGSVAASDAFFPFPDGVEVLAKAGVTAIIQPGGSIRDRDVVAACDDLGLAMLMTGRRHFRH